MKSKLLLVINFIVISLLLGYYGLFLAKKVDLTTADLGRHIENGKLIIHGTNTELRGVLYTNFYSYTMGEEPFVNHHWLSGVVFYLIYQAFGFSGLSWFYILLGCAMLWLFFDVARRKSNLFIASVLTIALMPLLSSRAEVRPEMFTYFFTGVFLWCLSHGYADTTDSADGKADKSARYTYILPVVMLIWVNLHIGFVFGFLVLGAFCIEQYIIILSRICREWPLLAAERGRFLGSNLFLALSKHWRGKIKSLTTSAFLCVLAALINPNFIKGLVYPLNIFKNYGYLIVENQSIKFLENLNFTTGQNFLLFKIVCGLVFVSFIVVAIKNYRKISVAMVLLTIVTGYLAYSGIRHFPSFAFFSLVALANNINSLSNIWRGTGRGYNLGIVNAIFIPIGLFIMAISLSQGYQSLKARADFGLGLLPGVEASAEFYKAQNIKGPVFNDYDIGGYLIYNLDPLSLNPSPSRGEGDSNRYIFVDNRPEAYTVDFFENYKLMQTDPLKWKEMDEKYNFNAIFFSHRDYTPWAQTFLISRVKDENWAVVFVDGFNIIFLKRNEQNAEIIKKFEIPKARFGITN